jgi:cardiolipin synthase
MPSVKRWAKAGVAVAAGLAAFYAFEAAQYKRTAAVGFDIDDPPEAGDPEFARLVEALTGAPLRDGNRIEVLRNGDEIFPAMLDAIRNAKHSVDFATYVYWTGSICPEFANALIDRANVGVEVNVLLDAVGAAAMDRELVSALERAGVRVAWFRPVRWFTLHKLNNRTHRKILVVDGRVGFTGGVGIADEWTGNGEDPDHWRDTHIRIEGLAARDLVGGFLENWSEATRSILTGRHIPKVSRFRDGVSVQVTRSAAAKGSTEAEELFYAAVASARRRIWLTTAYFAPRQAFVDVLCDAVERGVDVRVLTNGPHIDRKVVRQTGRTTYSEMLECGVRIFEYQKTMMHAKVMVVDGAWATVGSINFDNRSFALNDELNLSVFDSGVAATLEDHYREDLEDAEELDLDRWRARPPLARLKEEASSLLRREL